MAASAAETLPPAVTAADVPGLMERTCPHCGHGAHPSDAPETLTRYGSAEWPIARCRSCGFVYLPTVPTYDRLGEELAWEKSHAAEKQRREARPITGSLDRNTRWRLRLLGRNEARRYRRLFPAGRVLDVGCGKGGRIPEEYTPYGIEISQGLARTAREKMEPRGGQVIEAPAVEAIDQLEANSFAGVILRSYLEHEAQPLAVLKGTARVLRADGSAYVKVPNFGGLNRRLMGRRWCGVRLPDHVNYFTLSSLRRMARAAGLQLTLLNPLNLPLDDNIHAQLRPAPHLAHSKMGKD